MIKSIIVGNHEIETDSQAFFRETVRDLEKKGKVDGKDFFVSEITPHLENNDAVTRNSNDKRQHSGRK
jgi:hypothetical protein